MRDLEDWMSECTQSQEPVGRDVTVSAQEWHELQTRLAELTRENRLLQERLNAALDGTGICLWQGMIPSGELTVFNLQNFQSGQMVPHFDLWQAKLHPDDKPLVLASYHDHLAGKSPFYECEYRTVAADGEITWLWDRGRIIEWDAQGRPLRIMGAHIDITQRQEHKQHLARLAQTDPLTGLFNRQAFSEICHQRMGQSGLLHGLLFIDLDDFKAVNDGLGHLTGDRLLLLVADWLRQMMPRDALLARMGGDEFVVYLEQVADRQVACRLAERLLAQCQSQLLLEELPVRIGMSIGVALWSGGSFAYEAVLDNADRAMYRAKQHGKLKYEVVELAP